MKPQFLSIVQFPFDNCHSPFPPTTFFEIGVYALACVAGVIGEGEGERGSREKSPSFFLSFLAPLPLPRLRRPRRLYTHEIFAELSQPRSQGLSSEDHNRPFPNYLWPLFQSESWCSSFHMKISFHLHVNQN